MRNIYLTVLLIPIVMFIVWDYPMARFPVFLLALLILMCEITVSNVFKGKPSIFTGIRYGVGALVLGGCVGYFARFVGAFWPTWPMFLGLSLLCFSLGYGFRYAKGRMNSV